MAEFLTTGSMPSGKEVNSSGYATYMVIYSKSVTGKLLTDLQSIWKPEVTRDGIYFAESVSVCTDRNTGATVQCKLPSNYKDQEFITANTKTNKFYWAKNYADATAGKWTEITGKAKDAGFLANPNLLDKAILAKKNQQGEKQEGSKLTDDEGKAETNLPIPSKSDSDKFKLGFLPDFGLPFGSWFDWKSKNFWWLLGLIALFTLWRNRKFRRFSRRTARRTSRKVSRNLAA